LPGNAYVGGSNRIVQGAPNPGWQTGGDEFVLEVEFDMAGIALYALINMIYSSIP
jgi:hypothetical protein